MKNKVMTEQLFCDFCSKQTSYSYRCEECHRDMCSACHDKNGATYNAYVYCSGSGYYRLCKPCEVKLMRKPTPKFTAYQNIRHLRAYIEMTNKDLEEKKNKVEEAVKEFV